MRFVAFLAVLLTITALAWLLVAVHVADLVPGGWWSVATLWALSVVPVFVLVHNFTTGKHPSAATRLWLFRPFWYSQLLILVLALLATAAFLVAFPFGAGAVAGGGRSSWAPSCSCSSRSGATRARAGWWSATSRSRTRHCRPGWTGCAWFSSRIFTWDRRRRAPSWPGWRGPPATRIRISSRTRGDQVDDHPADVDAFAAAFGALTAPLGVYAIPGNHDVYAGWSEVRRRLEAMPVRVLVNDWVRLHHEGAEFVLAGTGDPAGAQVVRGPESGAPDIERTLGAVPPGAFVLVLAHNPALFPALAARGAHVVLSGHTHHGQFSIPSRNWSLASIFLDYAMGSYERDGAKLYISPGTNYWGVPFRIGALPEVSVVTLRRAPA